MGNQKKIVITSEAFEVFSRALGYLAADIVKRPKPVQVEKGA